MLKIIYRSILLTLSLGVILCGIYPLLIHGIGNLFFHDQASGGILERQGRPLGAKLIGQNFTKAEYFHGRPSAAGEKGYDASHSSGSHLGPTNQKLYDTLKRNRDLFLKDNPHIQSGAVPTNNVTSSASGLDPHISPESAFAQANRVALARGISADKMKDLIQKNLEGPQWGIFGEPVINVLAINMDLDESYPLLLPLPLEEE